MKNLWNFWHCFLHLDFFGFTISAKVVKGMNEEEIKQALLKKALGYESDEIVEEYSTDEKGNSFLCKRKITKKFTPPDISALKIVTVYNGMLTL